MEGQSEIQSTDFPNTSSETVEPAINEQSQNATDDIANVPYPGSSQDMSHNISASTSELTMLSSVETEMEKLHSTDADHSPQALCDVSEKELISGSESIGEDLQGILENNECQEDNIHTNNRKSELCSNLDENKELEKNNGQVLAENSPMPTVDTSDQLTATSSDEIVAGTIDQLCAENFNQPFSENSDQGSAGNSNQPSSGICDQPTAENTDQTSTENSDQPSAENSDQPSAENSDQPSAENSDQPSVEKSDQPSVENSDQPSVENSEQPSAENFDQSIADNSDHPNAENSDQPSAENSDQPLAGNSNQPLAGNSNQPLAGNSDQPCAENSNQTSAENADLPSTETTALPSTENPDLSSAEIADPPRTENPDLPFTENSDLPNTENFDLPNTENSDSLNTESSDPSRAEENSDQPESATIEDTEQNIPFSSENPLADENQDTNLQNVTAAGDLETTAQREQPDNTNGTLLCSESMGTTTPSELSEERDSISHNTPSSVELSNSQDETYSGNSVFDSFTSESTDECIIPDTQREFSQAEKEAASSIPPLRDISEANTGQNEIATDSGSTELSVGSRIRIFKYDKDDLQICCQCKVEKKASYYFNQADGRQNHICDDACLAKYKENQNTEMIWDEKQLNLRVKNFSETAKSGDQPTMSFVRKCASCKKSIEDTETNLTWEIMDFCNEFCLTKYQKEIGSNCASCKGDVKSNSLGKYCVRFGNDIRQFCSGACLEKYKKGVKVCSYCQQDMSAGPQGFLAPVGGKGQFKDFCSQTCMEKYDIMTNDKPPTVPPGTNCSVCKANAPITIEYTLDGKTHYCCREPCFVAFSFVNKISSGKCAMCKRHFPKSLLEQYTMYYDNAQYSFCSNSCENIYIIAHRKIVPCSWCKVKKYNFDMIRRYSKEGSVINMCSTNCLNLYRVSVSAVNSRQTTCNYCGKISHPLYHLTMSDATLRNFCTHACVMAFQGQFAKTPIIINNVQPSFPVPTGAPRKNKKATNVTDNGSSLPEVPQLPVIASVQSLATNGSFGTQNNSPNTRTTRSKAASAVTPMNPQIINSYADLPIQVQIKQHFIVRPAPIPEQRNVGTMCYTNKTSKSVMAKPVMVDQAIQTDEKEASKVIIPIPMPIYVPTPMHMFTNFTPVPFPIPVPVPIPVFIPTTSNSSAGIMKQIKKLQVIPSDPYEAEILMMAEMVAEEKKEDTTDSESDVDDHAGPDDSYSPEPVDANNTFGDDMLQMALKMASELDEPAVDLEGALTANTITAPQGEESHGQEENVDDPQPIHPLIADRGPSVRGRKRGMRQPRGGAKRGRRMSHHQVDMPMMQHQIQQPPPPPEPIEKPDANMCLKFTFGVNAWKQWVTTKNAELEKSGRVMLFKTEILQLTADELNYSLCLFVKEVRKPNGAEYAPDTIYYLCLGIQQYLFENGRIDNIFCDPYYEKFTDCLDEVAKKFSVLYNDSHYIVTRVEEEHLWESKQLGAHSPHVLLSTLMFFNTKHFNLTTVDEHMQLSFSHIMKHWKRNPNQPGAAKVPGSRNVLLRFYPPQSAIQNNARKKKVYEQQENEENPLRCPVKLYEFYLSKCPESVKTRNDVFYLQPERSCIPDSPVWYSTMPLPKEALEKMLHRVKMVKEINVALLTS